jgi:hypothetical protein
MYLSRADRAILSELERAHAARGGVRWDVIAAEAGVAHVDLGFYLRCLRDRALVRGVREFSLNGRTLYEATATPTGRRAMHEETGRVPVLGGDSVGSVRR